MQKKTKRKLNKKRFFGLLIFLAISISFICYLLNLKVSNVLIIGNQEILDSCYLSNDQFAEIEFNTVMGQLMTNQQTVEENIEDIPVPRAKK